VPDEAVGRIVSDGAKLRSDADRVTRAPSDVLRLVVAAALLLIVVLLAWLFDRTVVDNVANTLRGLDTVSGKAVALATTAAEVVGLIVFGSGVVIAAGRRMWLLIVSVLSAGVVAGALVLLLGHVANAEVRVTRLDSSLALVTPSHTTTATGLAVVTAFVTTASPWAARRWRHLAWTLVFLLGITQFVAAPLSFTSLIAILAGWTAGAAAVVAFGAPSRRPTQQAIADGMAAVGEPLAHIEPLSVDARGSTPYIATGTDGRGLFVKALGADQRSADLLFRLYRSAQPRNLGDERPFSSLRRMVEHEALVALAAHGFGARTPQLVAFATADPNGFVLAYEAIAGRSLDRLEPDEITDGVLHAIWEQLSILRRHRVAHRDLRLANVFLADDGEAWIIDFGFAELSASDLLLATDLAELLASSSARVGATRAVAAGVAVVGADAIAGALDRLQLPMLSGATREAMKGSPDALVDLRRSVELAAAASS
jgi:undecaprenyl-diphosphatase